MLRKETAWATEMANRPLVMVRQLDDISQVGELIKPYKIILENIGKGCAVNINLKIPNIEGVEDWSKQINSIGAEKTAEIMDTMFEAYLHGLREGKYFLNISYCDVMKKEYFSRFEFDGKGVLNFKDWDMR